MAQILVVEDEGVIAMEVQARLLRLGYDAPHIAHSGEMAITLTDEFKPDLVLMDIILDGQMSGIEAADHIRRHFAVPVIFLTAHADDATLKRAKLAGPFGYIVKPFSERDLQIAIEMGLYKHQMEEKLRQSEERLRLLIESSDDLVIIQDLGGRITYYHGSPRYGLTSEDLLGKTAADFLPEELALQILSTAKEIAITRQSKTFESEIFWQNQTFWLNIYLYPLKQSNEQVQFIAIIARDVTEVKRLKGLLPICAWCGKRIRDENNRWQPLDQFLATHTSATITHSICDECLLRTKSNT